MAYLIGMEKGKNNILRHAYSYLGRDIEENRRYLLLYAGKRTDEEDRKTLELIATEAYAHDWAVIVNSLKNGVMEDISDASLKADGRLWAMSQDDVMSIKLYRRECLPFLLRGGILSPRGLPEDFGYESVKLSATMLSYIADACIFINHVPQFAITEMLDRGVECAVARTALRERSARNALREGCPVIDSFSSWLMEPEAWAWRDSEGTVRLSYLL